MIDLRLLRSNPDAVRASQRARGADPSLVDQLLAADEGRRAALTGFERDRAEQKALGRQVAKAQGQQKAILLDQAKQLAEAVRAGQAAADAAAAELEDVLRRVDNVVEDGAPAGGEDDYVVLREVGTRRDFAAEGFEPLDHVQLGERLGVDTDRGAKVSGARFYFLKGAAARLELALLNAAVDQAAGYGFTPVITPTLVRPEVMAGTGFLGAHADEVYHLDKEDDLYLVGTSEVALAGMHSGEVLDLSAGPLRYAGWSACYRREAGSYGKDTRGIIRVHQFHKVEMFSWCRVEDAHAEHLRLLAWEEEMLARAELPYRVIDVAAGDLGSSAARKYDCEAWLPSQGRYREVTSTSNCTTYQARRLDVREVDPTAQQAGNRPVATLNGTLATTRWIVSILENHQLSDGTVRVPEGLRPYLGGQSTLGPAGRG